MHGHSNRDEKTIRLYGGMNEPTLNMFGKYAMFEWKLETDDRLVITGYDFGIGPNTKVMQVVSERIREEAGAEAEMK